MAQTKRDIQIREILGSPASDALGDGVGPGASEVLIILTSEEQDGRYVAKEAEWSDADEVYIEKPDGMVFDAEAGGLGLVREKAFRTGLVPDEPGEGEEALPPAMYVARPELVQLESGSTHVEWVFDAGGGLPPPGEQYMVLQLDEDLKPVWDWVRFKGTSEA